MQVRVGVWVGVGVWITGLKHREGGGGDQRQKGLSNYTILICRTNEP